MSLLGADTESGSFSSSINTTTCSGPLPQVLLPFTDLQKPLCNQRFPWSSDGKGTKEEKLVPVNGNPCGQAVSLKTHLLPKHNFLTKLTGRDWTGICIYMFIFILNGEGNGTPLQHSCLENPMDGGAWWTAVHGVAKSRTRLSDFTLTFHFHALEKEMATHSSVLACLWQEHR